MFSKNTFGPIVAETIGTFILAATAIGAAGYFNFTAPWYTAIAVGLALAVIVAMIGRVSGAHVNPAITLGMWTMRKIGTYKAIAYIAAQLLGGLLAFAFVEYVTGTDIVEQGSSTVDGRVFTAEMIGTAVFAFGVAAAVIQKLEGMYLAFAVGASLTVGILIASIGGPGFLNPAVALANNTWDKTVVIAPLLGAVIGMNVYSFFLSPGKEKPAKSTKKSKKK